jgi:hypothetical protein
MRKLIGIMLLMNFLTTLVLAENWVADRYYFQLDQSPYFRRIEPLQNIINRVGAEKCDSVIKECMASKDAIIVNKGRACMILDVHVGLIGKISVFGAEEGYTYTYLPVILPDTR